MDTASSTPGLCLWIQNNCSGGYITFYGFPDTWSPDPVAHGFPPVICPTIPNGSTAPDCALKVTSATTYNTQTQGQVIFNMPNGTPLTITWNINLNNTTNQDEGNISITCVGYDIQYLQANGSYGNDVYWTVTDINEFEGNIAVTEAA